MGGRVPLIFSVSLLAFIGTVPTPARAQSAGAILGGVIGGVIVGSMIAGARSRPAYGYAPRRSGRAVRFARQAPRRQIDRAGPMTPAAGPQGVQTISASSDPFSKQGGASTAASQNR